METIEDMYIDGKKGLTLLEVMVSMVILCIGLLGLAPLIVLSIEANSMSRDAIIASNIARDKIEYLESLDSIPASAFTEYESDVQAGFNRTTIIQDHASDTLTPEGLLRASIAVDWTDKVGVKRQTAISTYLHKR